MEVPTGREFMLQEVAAHLEMLQEREANLKESLRGHRFLKVEWEYLEELHRQAVEGNWPDFMVWKIFQSIFPNRRIGIIKRQYETLAKCVALRIDYKTYKRPRKPQKYHGRYGMKKWEKRQTGKAEAESESRKVS